MWQKINHWLTQHLLIAPLPIFAKMVLLYSSIVFFILLTVSVVTITSVHYIMNDSLRDELKSRAAAAIQYLDDYGKVDTTIFIRANVPPSMNLQIYDGAGHLIVDNGPTHAVRKLSDRYIDDAISNPQKKPLPTSVQGNESSEFSYYQLWTDKQGKNYYLRFSQRPDKETGFVSLLSKQLLASVLISLILTIFTGMYLMKRSLAPLQVINDTVKTIEVNRLDNRIALSDNKNELHDLAVSINQALDRIEYGYKQQQQFISDSSAPDSEGQHFICRQGPLGQLNESANLHAVHQRQCADPAAVRAGFTQLHGNLLGGEDLQHLLHIIPFCRLLPPQPGGDGVGHQKQLEIEVGLLLAQGNGQAQAVEQGFAAVGGAVGDDHNTLHTNSFLKARLLL